MASGKILAGIGIGVATVVAIAFVAIVLGGTQVASPQNNDVIEERPAKKVRVLVSFFPLYDFTRQVAGDRAEVSTMVPPGIEPHDWEPTPRQVQDARAADMLVFNGAGFESWIESLDARFAVNTSEGLELLASKEEHDKQDEEHEGEGHEEEHGHGVFDPHIWLDPILAKHQVEKIRAGLVTIDAENVDYYNANAARFSAELDELDAFIVSELSTCEKSDFIAFHEAFSYFADRYGLTQHAVHQSISPEGEILPQRLQEVISLAKELEISVIYAEDLVNPRLAEVIASELSSGRVLILSPIEGLTEDEQRAGMGYVEKMRQNVGNLKEGLNCS